MAISTHRSHEDRVRERAYEIYAQRRADGEPGDAESDWLAAEAELEADAITGET